MTLWWCEIECLVGAIIKRGCGLQRVVGYAVQTATIRFRCNGVGRLLDGHWAPCRNIGQIGRWRFAHQHLLQRGCVARVKKVEKSWIEANLVTDRIMDLSHYFRVWLINELIIALLISLYSDESWRCQIDSLHNETRSWKSCTNERIANIEQFFDFVLTKKRVVSTHIDIGIIATHHHNDRQTTERQPKDNRRHPKAPPRWIGT